MTWLGSYRLGCSLSFFSNSQTHHESHHELLIVVSCGYNMLGPERGRSVIVGGACEAVWMNECVCLSVCVWVCVAACLRTHTCMCRDHLTALHRCGNLLCAGAERKRPPQLLPSQRHQGHLPLVQRWQAPGKQHQVLVVT